MGDRLFNNDYRDMIECLQREGVEFMLVGGYDVALHRWPRMTFDDLILNKRASGRPKDIVDALTLERLKEKKNGQNGH